MDNMPFTKIYHLSHNDLDGYGSQYMTKQLQTIYKDLKILYFNTTYDNVMENINNIFEDILRSKEMEEKWKVKNAKETNILFLITDVSISGEIANKLNNFLKGNKNININIQVLDHHKTNIDIANKNSWYSLDISKCAAHLSADYVNTFHDNVQLRNYLSFLGSFIQSHDLYEKESPFLGFSNLLSDVVFSIYFPDFLENYKREFIFKYIDNFIETYLKLEDKNVEAIECQYHYILLNTLEHFLKNKEVLHDKNIRVIYKLYYYQYELYKQSIDKFETLDYKGFKFKLFYNLESTCYAQFSKYIIENNLDIDFVMNVKNKGNCGLRSFKETCDVSVIASEFDKKGGGHFHAAGCKIMFKQNVHSYEELLKEIEDIIYR